MDTQAGHFIQVQCKNVDQCLWPEEIYFVCFDCQAGDLVCALSSYGPGHHYESARLSQKLSSDAGSVQEVPL